MSSTFKIRKQSESWDKFDGVRKVTISSAKYDTYNGQKYLEIHFKELPDYLRCRLYEKPNVDDPNFVIMEAFRFTNTGISLHGEADGEKIVKVNDDPSLLVGKAIGVYTYETVDGWWRVAGKVFPVNTFQNDVEAITESDIDFYSRKTEDFVKKYIRDRKNPDRGDTTQIREKPW